jgi:hypothetical protein
MALPKLEIPTYELTLPSTGEKIKYRPFLVKEYKTLLTALESDADEVLRIVTELVDVCTFKKLSIESLPNFDIEYIFINLRSKSIGEIASLNLTCTKCESRIPFELDLTKTEIKKSAEHTTKIMVTDSIGLEMRYPKFVEMVEIYQSINSNDILSLVYSCVKCVYTNEEVFDNFSKEELEEFINSFSKAQFEMLEKFFLTMPKITQHIEKECPNCGTINSTDLEGLQNFFA